VKLIVTPAAAADAERLHGFLADKNPAAAQRIVTVLSEAIQSLTMLPNRGRPSTVAGVRELVVPFGRSACVLRYTYSAQADEVVIIRLWHGREARE
jgi:toxin ParE1/3/4